MKKIIVTICLAAGIVIAGHAQDTTTTSKSATLPVSVNNSFKKEFNEASNAQWKMKDGNYKVSFSMNGKKQMAAFDSNGTLLSKGWEISPSELPESINTSVKTTYADRQIAEVYKTDKNGTAGYIVKLQGSPETKLIYDANGQLIKDKQE